MTGQDLKVSKPVGFDHNGNGSVSDDPQWTAGAFGRITGTLEGASFLTFCVQLGQNWNLNASKIYKLLDTNETSGGLSGFNTSTAQNLARLYQAAYASSGGRQVGRGLPTGRVGTHPRDPGERAA